MSFLEIKNLAVHYPIRGGIMNRIVDYVYAVDGVSMTFEKGKIYGLVGESGSGKSTIGKAIIGLEKSTAGQILYEGKNITNRRRNLKASYTKDIQMIFQDATSAMDPRKRIQHIIAEPIRNFMKLSPKEEKRRIIELLEIVGMSEEALLKYPHEFSGGQKQRLGIARAVACNPRLIIADEPVSALDLSVQAQVLNFMKDIQHDFDLSYLFISHDLGVIRHMCDEIAIMYKGRFVETGTREDIYQHPQHEYTQRLLSAIPAIDPLTRAERKVVRQSIEKKYRVDEAKYYDEQGKVHPLKPLSNTHKVALTSIDKGMK